MGVCENVLNWFSSYIPFRTHKVRVNGCISKNISISQGGHISPLLFILYMNDVGLIFNNYAHFSVDADDLKLYCTISSLEDGLKLQKDFDYFCD